MNSAHYHLLVNHVPLFSLLFGVLALIWALVKKSNDMMLGATALFVLTGLFGWIAHETGEMAAQMLKQLPNFNRELVHTHAQAANFAQAAGFIVAIVAILTMIVKKKKPNLYRPLQIFLLIIGLWAFSVVARTAYLGGPITHTEIR